MNHESIHRKSTTFLSFCPNDSLVVAMHVVDLKSGEAPRNLSFARDSSRNPDCLTNQFDAHPHSISVDSEANGSLESPVCDQG